MKRALLFASCILAAAPAAAQDLTPDAAALKAHVAFLASDAMKGRATGSPELAIAEQYVAAQMEAAGLKPGGPNGAWLQPVPLIRYGASGKGSLTVVKAGAPVSLEWGKDYLPRGLHHESKFAVSGEVVFAGYGIVDPISGYNDYQGLDVKGRIVAVLRDAPHSLSDDARAHFRTLTEQTRIAGEHGAIGVILIEGNARRTGFSFARSVSGYSRPTMTWDRGKGPQSVEAPAFAYLSFEGAAKLFAGSKLSWDKVIANDHAKGKLPRGPLGIRVNATADSEISTLSANNVIGILEGGDKKGEFVAISAHLDHVGVGTPNAKGDAIYNGAMDNAAGTAAMLEVAKHFRKTGDKPRRSVLFIAVTAEEVGLLGSEYFAFNPTVPKGSIVANVNLDMPVLTYAFEDVVAIGADHSSVGEVVAQAAASQGVKVVPDTMPEENFFVRTDHYSFVKAGIPAVSLDLGPGGPGAAAQKEFLENHYHEPSDEVGLIDFNQGLRFVKLNYAIARALADADSRPVWNKGNFFGTLYKGPMAK